MRGGPGCGVRAPPARNVLSCPLGAGRRRISTIPAPGTPEPEPAWETSCIHATTFPRECGFCPHVQALYKIRAFLSGRPFSTCDVEEALFRPLLTLRSQWISQRHRFAGTTMAMEDGEWMIEARGRRSGAESFNARIAANIDRDRGRERTTALVPPRPLIAFTVSAVYPECRVG